MKFQSIFAKVANKLSVFYKRRAYECPVFFSSRTVRPKSAVIERDTVCTRYSTCRIHTIHVFEPNDINNVYPLPCLANNDHYQKQEIFDIKTTSLIKIHNLKIHSFT